MTIPPEIQTKAREVLAEIHKTGLYMDAVEVLTLALSAAHREGFEEGMKRAVNIYAEARTWDYFGSAEEAILDELLPPASEAERTA